MVGEFSEQVRPQLLPRIAVVSGQPAPADSGYRPFGEHVGDDFDERRACLVVRQPARARLLDRPLRSLGVDPHGDVRQFDRQRAFGQSLAVGDRRREHVQDLARTLEPRDVRDVLCGDVQSGDEVAGGGEHHVGFAKGRQDAGDVVQERRVGADHEHTMAFDPFPLGVEQVRDAVQRDHGFPGARAALDHQHPWVFEPDDLVLFGLDRRHDVAHPVTARRVDRREQGRVTLRVRRRGGREPRR